MKIVETHIIQINEYFHNDEYTIIRKCHVLEDGSCVEEIINGSGGISYHKISKEYLEKYKEVK